MGTAWAVELWVDGDGAWEGTHPLQTVLGRLPFRLS
jgi:hypothetical protein